MATQHTAAPWAIRTASYGALAVGPAVLPHPGKDARILDTLLARREADAALIAAAPDMLAALKAAIASPLTTIADPAAYAAVRAAIAKAGS